MVFSSIVFLCAFMPAVVIIYSALSLLRGRVEEQRLLKLQNIFLLLASLMFYAYGEPVYILLMCASALVCYLSAMMFGRVGNGGRKMILAATVAVELGILGVFKYAGMFAGLIDGAFGTKLGPVGIALPIGISFYTFQALSYVIDVYRGETTAQKNFLTVLLYISFFPQLIAGPIIKYQDIERQLVERRQTLTGCAGGMKHFCLGLAKKVLIANNVAVAADAIFGASPSEIGTGAAWLAALSYMLQIYFDFSGYSDMAIGLGNIFGFTIRENFNDPYISGSIKEFWRRWHISLSLWFREYLYIPLGGNRRGRARTVINKLIVFALTGLWHGANWTFLLWGIYHGLLLTAEDGIRNAGIRMSESTRRLWNILRHILVLLAVCVGFVIFRAESITTAFMMISRMSGVNGTKQGSSLALEQLTPLFITAFAAGVLLSARLDLIFPKLTVPFRSNSRAAVWVKYIVSAALLILCIISLSGSGYNPFIYFRF